MNNKASVTAIVTLFILLSVVFIVWIGVEYISAQSIILQAEIVQSINETSDNNNFTNEAINTGNLVITNSANYKKYMFYALVLLIIVAVISIAFVARAQDN